MTKSTLKVTNPSVTAFKSQQHPFHILDASPFPFLTGLFLATLLVPLTPPTHVADLLGLLPAEPSALLLLPLHASAVKARNLLRSLTIGPLFFPLIVSALSSLVGSLYFFASGLHVRTPEGAARAAETLGWIPSYYFFASVYLVLAIFLLAVSYILGVIFVGNRPAFRFSADGYLAKKLGPHLPLTGPWSVALATRLLQRMRFFCASLVAVHLLLLKYLYILYFFLWLFLGAVNRLLRHLNPEKPGEILQRTTELRTVLWKQAVLLWEQPQATFATISCLFLLYVAFVGLLCHFRLTRPNGTSTMATPFLLFLLLADPRLIAAAALLDFLYPRTSNQLSATLSGGSPADAAKLARAIALHGEEQARLAANQARLGILPAVVPGSTPLAPGTPAVSLIFVGNGGVQHTRVAPDTAELITRRGAQLSSLRDPEVQALFSNKPPVLDFFAANDKLSVSAGVISSDGASQLAGAVAGNIKAPWFTFSNLFTVATGGATMFGAYCAATTNSSPAAGSNGPSPAPQGPTPSPATASPSTPAQGSSCDVSVSDSLSELFDGVISETLCSVGGLTPLLLLVVKSLVYSLQSSLVFVHLPAAVVSAWSDVSSLPALGSASEVPPEPITFTTGSVILGLVFKTLLF